MTLLHIREWYGRLGNNILQMKHVLTIALFYKCNIFIPKHDFFNKEMIILFDGLELTTDSIYVDNDSCDFFYKEKLCKFNDAFIAGNESFVLDILKQLFTLNVDILESLHEEDLVIHIRSGDIFSNDPLPYYVMPPLSYYINIIESNNYKSIHLLTEDRLNPCVDKLLELYPNIKFRLANLIDDVSVILTCKHIVMSFGTFVPALLLLSNYIQKVYVPSYICKVGKELISTKNIEVVSTDLEQYIRRINGWRNTPEQRALMLEFEHK